LVQFGQFGTFPRRHVEIILKIGVARVCCFPCGYRVEEKKGSSKIRGDFFMLVVSMQRDTVQIPAEAERDGHAERERERHFFSAL
jgi:hypothetical protein